MSRVFLTGANGVIGKIIRAQVREHSYTCFDLPENDARNYAELKEAMRGTEVLIHLAWNTEVENWLSEDIDPENILLTFNAYRAAKECGLKRVIMASSIHVNDLYDEWKRPRLLSPDDTPSPDSPYGASKVFVESLGRYWSKNGLEVVCIRFMGLNEDNRPNPTSAKDPLAKEKWFSHRDCGDLIRAIISAPTVPGNFSIVYGVSNNTGRPVQLTNPFGWVPQDNSANLCTLISG